MKKTIAAASAPTSGRARRREIRDRGSRLGASGLAGAAEGSVTTDELMDCSWEWWGRGGGGGQGGARPPGMSLWFARGGGGGGGAGLPRPPPHLDYRVLLCAYWTIGPMF